MKKILVLFAVLLVAFMVFACGQTATTPTPAATTDGTTAAQTTAKPTDAPTSATTVVTTEATTTTEVTTTTGTTAPITAGDVYVDFDFSDEDGITEKTGNVTFKEVGTAGTNLLRVTHNGLTKVKDVLTIKQNSWIECTFTNLADASQLNKLVEEVGGWTIEAFYLNKETSGYQAIVCVTEGNAGKGKQGWGLAHDAGNPYFITGDGVNGWYTTGRAGLASKTELSHVVAVYDAVAKTNTVYLNGVAIKTVAANGFAAADALGKDSTGEKVFSMGNGFFIGADPTVGSSAADYDAKDLTVVDVKIYAGALTAEKVAEAYTAAAADFQTETVEEALIGAGYDLDDFNKLEITPTLHRYWNSTSADLHSVLNGADEDATSIKFFATQKFTKEQIPFGSVIVVLDGYKYRADGWQENNAKSSTRGSEYTAKVTIVNRAWWSDYTVRGFNVANKDGSSTITADEYAVFAIFVPKSPVNEVTPTENNFVVFVPAGNTTSAINVTTGETIADVEAINYVEIKGGYFYVANKEGDTVKIFREVGAAIEVRKTTAAATNVFKSLTTGKNTVMGYTRDIIKNVSKQNNILNAYMNTKLMSLNLDGLNLGKFGTITITDIESDAITVKDEANNSFYITDKKVNFVYFDYEGTKLVKATGNAYTPLGMNHMEMIRYAQDIALGKEYGYSRSIFQTAMASNGGYTSVVTHNGKYDGTTQQTSTMNEWKASNIYNKYASILANYQTYVNKKDESTIKADLTAADAALVAAQAAYDAAIEANADLKALKATMDEKEAAYTATRQPHYEARAAYETSKSLKGADHAETLALKPAFDDATAVMNAAKELYDTAKAAFDAKVTEVLAADAAFKALSDTLAAAKTAQSNASKAQAAIDDYKVWKPLYDKFVAEYEKVVNVALWTEDDVDNETLDTTSVIGKMFKDIAADKRAYPTFTYYYDEAAKTYTIFITSAKQASAPGESFTSNTVLGSLNTIGQYNQ